MYVCLCNGVTDRQIRQAIADGAQSMRELRQQLGLCSSCGRCGVQARELLQQSRQAVSARPASIRLPSTDEHTWSPA